MLIAIGDVHGEVGKLRSLLQKLRDLPLEPSDKLIFLGDYVDRGPDVRQTLELLIDLQRQRPNTVFLRGNHDQTMLDVRDVADPDRDSELDFADVDWWFRYGGQQTMRSYGGGPRWYERVPASHWTFLEQTGIEYAIGGYIFVHAGLLPPNCPWAGPEDPRLWIREEFLNSTCDFGARVVYGHTVSRDGRPKVEATKIGIDTGAVYGGSLTAVLLAEDPTDSPLFIQS